ncbi:MAG: thioesterase [Clostridia bacterium]|nr:thioesterase [Clostridia bacterium]
MEKSYSERFALRTSHCDLHGDWRPGAILEAMQETAAAHCARLGIGRDVTDGLGIAWVLSRTRVELTRVPRLGEIISVETWPLPTKHLFFPRVNAIRDAEGTQIGAANSLWVLLDLNTRRIVGSDVVLAHLPDNRDMPTGPALGAVRLPEGEAESRLMTPPYADFDVNGHVNNTRYLDWACSALGHGTMATRRVAAFTVSYEGEILPGTDVRTELVRNGDQFAFCGFAGDRRCFAVGGTLAPRNE